MAHAPTAEEQWGHLAEQEPALPDPVAPTTATQLRGRMDDLYVRYMAYRARRDEQMVHQAREPRAAPFAAVPYWFTTDRTHEYFSEDYLRFRDAMIASATPVIVDTPERILYQSSSGMVWENFSGPIETKKPKGRVFNLRWSGKP